MIRGNHDQRPSRKSYQRKVISTELLGGFFLVEENYPDLLFTEEYGWYRFGETDVFIIGGAYSADKHYRLEQQYLGFKNYRWFPDEQLTQREMDDAYDLLTNTAGDAHYCTILTHTCPQRFTPTHKFIPSIDQSTVDTTMERWLDDLYGRLTDDGVDFEWFCGHWHTDERVGNMHFVYNDVQLFYSDILSAFV